MPGAAPGPILGTCDQPTLHRVTVHVIQLFQQFRFTVNVEVIVAGLSEGIRRVRVQFVRHLLLEHLQEYG